MEDVLAGLFGLALIGWAFWMSYRRAKWVITGKGHPLIKDIEDGQK